MANKRTIDGVSRKYVMNLTQEAHSTLLGMVEHCLKTRACMGMDEGFKDLETEEEHDFVKELRALLDQPKYPRVIVVKGHKPTCAKVQPGSTHEDICDCAAVDGTAQEVKQQWVSVEALNRVSTELEELRARNQGPPVAWYRTYMTGRSPDFYLGAQPVGVALPQTLEPLFTYQPAPTTLTVWYGSMPESNGKTNWTAILYRKGGEGSLIGALSKGITISRSEYPDRVRYEADCMRHLIGELEEAPDILAYDTDLHSGYKKQGQD